MCLITPESPLLIAPLLASEIGLEEAIILQQLNYWLTKTNHIIDGQKWIWQTYEQWLKQLPFLTIGGIRRAIANLKSKCLIRVERHSKHTHYQANWYTINHQAIESLWQLICQNQQIDIAENDTSICLIPADGCDQNEQIISRDYSSGDFSSKEFSSEEEAPAAKAAELNALEIPIPQEQEQPVTPKDVEVLDEKFFMISSKTHDESFSAGADDAKEKLNLNLSGDEIDLLKLVHKIAHNPSTMPWRDSVTQIKAEVQRAVFEANPQWYSTDSGAVNLKKIGDRIKSLERQMKGIGAQAIEAYNTLMNYTRMANMSSSGLNFTQILKTKSEEIELQRIHEASKKKFEL